MKKFLSMLLTALLALTVAACGNTEGAGNAPKKPAAEKASDAVPSSSGKEVLVAYFSCTGNTKALAQDMAGLAKADIFEIQPVQPYTNEDLNYNDESTRATVEQKNDAARPEIKNRIENFGQYKTVIIAYPIWWGLAPRIMDTFMESYDFSGKTILPVCTSGGSDIGSSADYLKELTKGAEWKTGRRFGTSDSKAEMEALLKQTGILR